MGGDKIWGRGRAWERISVRQACLRPSVGGGFMFVPRLLLAAPSDWRESDGVGVNTN